MTASHFVSRYEEGCPNCGQTVDAKRLARGLPCARCLPRPPRQTSYEAIRRALERQGTLQQDAPWHIAHAQAEEAQRITRYFEEATGHHPTKFNHLWALRIARRESFAMVAPTGVGKTTFGLVAIAYLLATNKAAKALVLVPTNALVTQAVERLERLGVAAFALRAEKSSHRRAQLAHQLEEGDFSVAVCTVQFFYRHFAELARHRYDFVFVDDADAFLRSSRKTHLLFRILGFSEEEIMTQTPSEGPKAQLVVASATLRPSPQKLLLFQRLVGFSVGNLAFATKEVARFHAPFRGGLPIKRVVSLARAAGDGVFVLVPRGTDPSVLEEVRQALEARGVRVLLHTEFAQHREAFERGEYQVAVGIAHQYNPLVRGVDILRAKLVIFVGVPTVRVALSRVRRGSVFRLVVAALSDLPDWDEETRGRLRELARSRQLTFAAVAPFLSPEACRKVSQRAFFVLTHEEGGEIVAQFPDLTTFIQAEGRVSRLSARGVLRGVSVVLHENRDLWQAFLRRLTLTGDAAFAPLHMRQVREALRAAREDRERAQEQPPAEAAALDFRARLVVVESPTKARTIARFYGKPAIRRVGRGVVYEIPARNLYLATTASLGHIVDLDARTGLWGVDPASLDPYYTPIRLCRNGHVVFEAASRCPLCGEEIVTDKHIHIQALRDLAAQFDEVMIATDPDIEGEKIGEDLRALLRPFQPNLSRIEMHEITQRAFEEALQQPRTIATALVDAQIVRRVFDRWVGFYLTAHLRERYQRWNVSAGRVQTPVLGWVIERARLAREKRPVLVFTYRGLPIEVPFADEAALREWKEQFAPEQIRLSRRKTQDAPPPPFDTNALLEEASRRLRLSAQRTMHILQQLFELGLITYHRTDSTYVSSVGIGVAHTYMERKGIRTLFVGRHWGKPGTHECIRPTRPVDRWELPLVFPLAQVPPQDRRDFLAVYDLVARRFFASQSKAAVVEEACVILPGETEGRCFAVGLREEGFWHFWPRRLFTLTEEGIANERIVWRAKARPWTEGELVRAMKEKGIGRPSTWAHIIETLKRRRFVVEKGGRLFPTRLGISVYSTLAAAYPRYVSEAFTRELEATLRQVEEGAPPKRFVRKLQRALFGKGEPRLPTGPSVKYDEKEGYA